MIHGVLIKDFKENIFKFSTKNEKWMKSELFTSINIVLTLKYVSLHIYSSALFYSLPFTIKLTSFY